MRELIVSAIESPLQGVYTQNTLFPVFAYATENCRPFEEGAEYIDGIGMHKDGFFGGYIVFPASIGQETDDNGHTNHYRHRRSLHTLSIPLSLKNSLELDSDCILDVKVGHLFTNDGLRASDIIVAAKHPENTEWHYANEWPYTADIAPHSTP